MSEPDKELRIEKELKAMPLPKLVQLYEELDDLCHGRNACYSLSDLRYLAYIEHELFRREEISREFKSKE